MTKLEQISREAEGLSDEQLEATLHFIRTMKRDPFFFSAPQDALDEIEAGLKELERGETVELSELSRRLDIASKPK